MTSTKGFFTDVTLCIGCKACEVACKQWNELPADGLNFSGYSFDNTVELSATTWRHVSFVERRTPDGLSWLFLSDVCKHCERAGCLEACPTGAIIRTEFGSVFVQPDVCNGCGYCIVACPFGVIGRAEVGDLAGTARKCTLCYDRLTESMTPACAKACPTDSIQFGDLDELRERAGRRLDALQAAGRSGLRLYGHDPDAQPGTGGLHAFFLLADEPETYNLPPDPVAPARLLGAAWASAAASAVAMAAAAFLALAGRRR